MGIRLVLRGLVAASTVCLLIAGTWDNPIATSAHESAPLFSIVESGGEARQQLAALSSLSDQWEEVAAQAERRRRPRPYVLAAIPRELPITARPGGGRIVGQMPAGSRYYGTQHVAWIQKRSKNGRFGKVSVPYSGTRSAGWIRIAGLDISRTRYAVRADLSRHRIAVTRLGKVIARFPAATGSPNSPTPPGRYFVTDLVPFSPSSPLGAFAFGISGIQPNLPAGWSGGDQLAIHGTNDPGSIGQSVSAGCLRVSRPALERLKSWLKHGTPVVIRP